MVIGTKQKKKENFHLLIFFFYIFRKKPSAQIYVYLTKLRISDKKKKDDFINIICRNSQFIGKTKTTTSMRILFDLDFYEIRD